MIALREQHRVRTSIGVDVHEVHATDGRWGSGPVGLGRDLIDDERREVDAAVSPPAPGATAGATRGSTASAVGATSSAAAIRTTYGATVVRAAVQRQRDKAPSKQVHGRSFLRQRHGAPGVGVL